MEVARARLKQSEAGAERHQRIHAVGAEPVIDGFRHVMELLGQVDQVFGEA